MILQILGTVLVLVIVYLIRECYLIPKKTMKAYVDYLQAKGYRVKAIPYNLFYMHFDLLMNKEKNHGDPFKAYREEYPNYDVIVTNILNKALIEFLHPDFIKDFYSVDKHYSYPKTTIALDFIKRISGIGLPFSEGKVWKHKRALFNSVFNFEFLKSQTATIEKISDKSMQKFETVSMLPANEKEEKIAEYNLLELFV